MRAGFDLDGLGLAMPQSPFTTVDSGVAVALALAFATLLVVLADFDGGLGSWMSMSVDGWRGGVFALLEPFAGFLRRGYITPSSKGGTLRGIIRNAS